MTEYNKDAFVKAGDLDRMLNELVQKLSSMGGGLDLDTIYPVGSIYLSFENTSPASFLGGTWEQIVDKFLRLSNNTDVGGADNITLTTGQMPIHRHNGYDNGSPATTTVNGPQHYLKQVWTWIASGQSQSSLHGITMTTNTGGSTAHSNMPAYQNVYGWKRIA